MFQNLAFCAMSFKNERKSFQVMFLSNKCLRLRIWTGDKPAAFVAHVVSRATEVTRFCDYLRSMPNTYFEGSQIQQESNKAKAKYLIPCDHFT